MAMVYHQQMLLTSSNQIINLSQIWTCRYNAQMAENQLKNILQERGESYYNMYKCICKYKGELIEEDMKSFCTRLKVDRNREPLKDINTKLFFKKLNLMVEKAPLRSPYMDKYIMELIVYK